MKKHNEGYTLVLVMVVLVVLSLLATIVLSASLRNVQIQQKAVERLQDKYAAEAEVEKILGAIQSVMTTGEGTIPVKPADEIRVILSDVENQGNQLAIKVISTTSPYTQIDAILQLEGATFTVISDESITISGGAYAVKCISYDISSDVQEGGSGE